MKVSPLAVSSFLLVVAATTTSGVIGQATWKPGDFSDGNVIEDTERGTKIFLSNGLMGKAFVWDGEPVMADDGTKLADAYHTDCDGGATFDKGDGSGGYYYVSNSENGAYPNELVGGAYSMEFTADHKLIGYKQILSNTAQNCHGGATAWKTWISCEEYRSDGRCWQTDPFGLMEARPTNLTGIWGHKDYGNWEAFAWDDESTPPRGYTTNDDFPDDDFPLHYRGAIVRFTPDEAALECYNKGVDTERWCAIESGTHDYLKLIPASDGASTGTFEWVADVAESNPALYGGSEGAHVEGGILTFSTVLERYLFRLNLNDMTYVRSAIPFPFEPDNLRVLGDRLYLCSDGDHQPGDALWGWDSEGAYRIFYEEGHNYPAGIDFTPDNKMFYVSMYGEATWQFWREDGLAFDEPTAGIVYEVDGGMDEGKLHSEITYVTTDGSSHDEPASTTEDAEATTTAETTSEGSAETTSEGAAETATEGAAETPASSAPKTKIAAAIAGLITFML